MSLSISEKDREFITQVEACEFPIPEFNHKAHIRLAYAYLVENNTKASIQLMKNTLIGLLEFAGIEPSQKYHETITKAWVLAVHHFMSKTSNSESADEFINKNPELLDSKIMLTHYSAEVLFSQEARESFIEPNLSPIPRHDS